MSYIEATLVIDGAVADAQTFVMGEYEDCGFDYWPNLDGVTFREWFTRQRNLSEHSIADWEVYVLEHDHPMLDDTDCACVQYLTDLSPYWRAEDDWQAAAQRAAEGQYNIPR